MSSRLPIKFTNNPRTVFFIVLVVSAVYFGIFWWLEWQPPKTFTFAIACILYPIAAMQKSRESLKSSTEMKDVSTDEMTRLRYISSKRSANILNTILFYIVGATLTALFIAANIEHDKALMIGASLIIGLLTSAIYSTYAAHIESDEVSDFKSKIQERANRKAQQEAFVKKITEASKSKA